MESDTDFMASCLPCPEAYDAAEVISMEPLFGRSGLVTNAATRGISRLRSWYPPLPEDVPIMRTHWETRYFGHKMRSKVFFTGMCDAGGGGGRLRLTCVAVATTRTRARARGGDRGRALTKIYKFASN
jgi:hypothetical protein